MKKICFAASSGGHLAEALQLKALGEEHKTVLLTEQTEHRSSFWIPTIYYVPQVNRRQLSCVPGLIKNFFVSLKLLRTEKPDIVISTGALATIPICLLAHWMRIRLIYIESFARVKSASKTGKLLYRVADKTIVQWKELLSVYPNAVYGGSIY